MGALRTSASVLKELFSAVISNITSGLDEAILGRSVFVSASSQIMLECIMIMRTLRTRSVALTGIILTLIFFTACQDAPDLTVDMETTLPSDLPPITLITASGEPGKIREYDNRGRFEIENNCLVFKSSLHENTGTVIFTPNTKLSKDQKVIQFPDNVSVKIGAPVEINGFTQKYREGFWDKVVSSNMPEHCPEPITYIDEIKAPLPRQPGQTKSERIESDPKIKKFWIPADIRISENGRPLILRSTRTYGKFEIQNNCLVFVNEKSGLVAAAIMLRGNYISHDRTKIVQAVHTIPIGKRVSVMGQRPAVQLKDWEAEPIPKTCPNISVYTGVLNDTHN